MTDNNEAKTILIASPCMNQSIPNNAGLDDNGFYIYADIDQNFIKAKNVIDVYYKGVMGLTYSYTYATMQEATGCDDLNDIYNLDADDVVKDVYIIRNQIDEPTPPQYLGER